jgi:hypothetical protein
MEVHNLLLPRTARIESRYDEGSGRESVDPRIGRAQPTIGDCPDAEIWVGNEDQGVRHLAVATALLGATLAAALLAALAAAPRAGAADPTPQEVVTPACNQLKTDMSAADFQRAFGSASGCVSRLVTVLQAADTRCASSADKAACVQREFDAGLKAAVESGKPTPALPSVAELAGQLKTRTCEAARAQRGARFSAAFASLAACEARIAVRATSLATSMRAACAGNANPESCLQAALTAGASGLRAQITEAVSPTAAQLADRIADETCRAAKPAMGTRFDQRFGGSIDACKSALAADSAQLARDAAASCAGSTDAETCVRTQVEVNTVGLRLTLGEGAQPTHAEVARAIADEACRSAKERLGARFAAQLGSPAACAATVARRADSAAESALAACAAAADKDGCLRQAIESNAASFQFDLGAGAAPSAATIAEQIAGEACAEALTRLREPRFSQRLGSLDRCRARARPVAAQLAAGAIAGCRGAYDEEGCIRQGLSTAAAAVEAALGAAPTAGEIAAEIAGEACAAAREQLRGDFAKKLGTMAACVTKARPEALRLAAPALAGCSTAKVVQTCVRAAIEAAASRIEGSLTAR